jgi:hypothetical protein
MFIAIVVAVLAVAVVGGIGLAKRDEKRRSGRRDPGRSSGTEAVLDSSMSRVFVSEWRIQQGGDHG